MDLHSQCDSVAGSYQEKVCWLLCFKMLLEVSRHLLLPTSRGCCHHTVPEGAHSCTTSCDMMWYSCGHCCRQLPGEGVSQFAKLAANGRGLHIQCVWTAR